MSYEIQDLLDQNQDWAARQIEQDPDFFNRLAAGQNPRLLWIGCSDSRVPANQITGLRPGDVFVQRNVANVVLRDDANCMAVVQIAVRVLKVRHIIVCGHYDCTGVRMAMEGTADHAVKDWLVSVEELTEEHADELNGMNEAAKLDRLCELNVHKQVRSLCRSDIVQEAWQDGHDLKVHGLIYGIGDGLLRDLGYHASSMSDLEKLT